MWKANRYVSQWAQGLSDEALCTDEVCPGSGAWLGEPGKRHCKPKKSFLRMADVDISLYPLCPGDVRFQSVKSSAFTVEVFPIKKLKVHLRQGLGSLKDCNSSLSQGLVIPAVSCVDLWRTLGNTVLFKPQRPCELASCQPEYSFYILHLEGEFSFL